MAFDTDLLVDSIIPLLDQLNCVEVRVCFAGGGDSGEIHSVYFNDKDGKGVYPWNETGEWKWSEAEGRHVKVEPEVPAEPEPTLTIPSNRRMVLGGKLFEVGDDLILPLTQVIEEYAYSEVSSTDVDWYNNEGGNGEWVLSKADDGSWSRSLVIDINVTYTQTEYDSTVEICPPAKMTPSMDLSNIDPDVLARAAKRAEEEIK